MPRNHLKFYFRTRLVSEPWARFSTLRFSLYANDFFLDQSNAEKKEDKLFPQPVQELTKTIFPLVQEIHRIRRRDILVVHIFDGVVIPLVDFM